MIEQQNAIARTPRWYARMVRAMLREPAVILMERDGDLPRRPGEQDDNSPHRDAA